MQLNSSNYHAVSLLVAILFSSIVLSNNGNYFGKGDNIYNENDFFNLKFLQNSYSIEEDEEDDSENEDKESNIKKDKSIFNIVAVGDYDCNGGAEDTVDNIMDQDPELVLALGDFSYSGDADCWLELIEPIANETKIVFGNHEDEDDYMDFFGLKEQYYSFNYKNMHFLALSTETDYDDESEQYQFFRKL